MAEDPDFSAGFEKLEALGLPDLKSAAWVQADTPSVQGSYTLRALLRPLEGNAWQLADGTLVPLGDVTPREGSVAADGNSGGGFLSALASAFSGRKAKSDPAADAGALVKSLADPENSYYLRRIADEPEVAGQLLLFAAQLHSAGHPEAANQLAVAVFALPIDAESLLDMAVSRMAEARAAAVLAAFYAEPDWARLESGLMGLTGTFSRGWARRAEVLALAARVRKQIADGISPLPAPIAPVPDGLSGEIEAWLAPAEAATTPDDSPGGEPADEEAETPAEDSVFRPWSLPSPDDEQDPPFLRHGMAALAALIPLLDDATLTVEPAAALAEEEEEDYESASSPSVLTLPASRADRAAELIRLIVPDAAGLSPEELRPAALAFWEAHHTQTPVEIAAAYLTGDDDSLQQAAGAWLAAHGGEGADEVFAAWALEPAYVRQRLDLSRQWIRLRKQAATDFVARLATSLRRPEPEEAGVPEASAETPEELRQLFDNVRESRRPPSPEQTEGLIRSLELLTTGEDLAGRLLLLARDERPAAPVLEAMAEEFGPLQPDDILPPLLQAAAAAGPASVAAFLQYAENPAYARFREGQTSPLTDSTKAALLTLLENTTPVPPGERSQFYAETVQGWTAALMVWLDQRSDFTAATSYTALTGEPAAALLLQRALARLRGEPEPSWPDADKVAAPRLTEIVKSLDGLAPKEIFAVLAGLAPDEKAAVAKWMEKESDELPRPDSLKALRGLIHGDGTVAPFARMPRAAESAAILTGTGFGEGAAFSRESLVNACRTLGREASRRSPQALYFRTPGRMGLGWQAGAWALDPAGTEKMSAEGKLPIGGFGFAAGNAGELFSTNAETSAVVCLTFYMANAPVYSHWTVNAAGEVAAEPDSPAALDALAAFQEAADTGATAMVYLFVLTREHAALLPSSRPRY